MSIIGELASKVIHTPMRRLKRLLVGKGRKVSESRPAPEPAPRRKKQDLLYKKMPFRDSEDYWITRYATGGDSGAGSYNKQAEYKAKVLNDFVRRNNVKSVIEYGCGDGNQLKLALYPKYLGFDVSPKALSICEDLFRLDRTKNFKLMKEYEGEKAELTLSLDVIYHLVEDEVFESYMRTLFGSSERFVIIYSSNRAVDKAASHVRHRGFSKWVENNLRGWKLVQHIPNKHPRTSGRRGSLADFYVYGIDQDC